MNSRGRSPLDVCANADIAALLESYVGKNIEAPKRELARQSSAQHTPSPVPIPDGTAAKVERTKSVAPPATQTTPALKASKSSPELGLAPILPSKPSVSDRPAVSQSTLSTASATIAAEVVQPPSQTDGQKPVLPRAASAQAASTAPPTFVFVT